MTQYRLIGTYKLSLAEKWSMAEVDQDRNSKSLGFLVLAALAVGFFLLTLIVSGFLGYILARPRSDLAGTLMSVLSIGQSPDAALRLEAAVDLLIGAVGTTGSLSLSLALAAIYLSQNRILHSQSQIQKDQAKIMQRQKVPMVAAHESGLRFHEGKPTLEAVSPDGSPEISTNGTDPYVSIAVENHGSEPANQLQLACLVDVPADDDPLIHCGVAELTVDDMVTEPPRGKGALLPPTDSLSLLRGIPALSASSNTVQDTKMFVGGIVEQLQKLNGESGGSVRFGFVLIFTNSVEERFKIPIEPAYSINVEAIPEVMDEDERATFTTLRERAVVYDIDELIDEDTGWTIPEEAFSEQ